MTTTALVVVVSTLLVCFVDAADRGQAAAASYQRFGEKVFVDPDPNPIGVILFLDHPTVTSRVKLCVTYDPWSKGESPRFVK